MSSYLTGELVPTTVGPRPATTPAVPGVVARDRLATAWLAAQLSEHTRAAYRRDLTRYFAWADEFGVDVLAARRVHIDGYRQCLRDGSTGRRYGNASIARKLAAVSSFYRHAVEQDAVQGNPAAAVRRPPAPRSDTPWLTIPETQTLFAAAEDGGPWDAALVKTLYYTAVRVSELCHATTADLRTVEGELTMAVTRKGDRRERVVVAAPAAAALRAHLAGRTGPLFLVRGRAVNRRQVAYAVSRVARAAGLGGKNLTPHGLRHSFVTHMLRAGADPNAVREHAGHSRMETTLRYLRSAPSVHDSPAHRAAQLVEGRGRTGPPAET